MLKCYGCTVVSAPSAPTIVGTIGAKTVFLTWTQTSQDVVNNYTLSYRSVDSCPTATSGAAVIIAGSVRQYNLTSLEEAIEYEITLAATNCEGSVLSIRRYTTKATREPYQRPLYSVQSQLSEYGTEGCLDN